MDNREVSKFSSRFQQLRKRLLQYKLVQWSIEYARINKIKFYTIYYIIVQSVQKVSIFFLNGQYTMNRLNTH